MTGLQNRTSCAPCLEGFYCRTGTRYPYLPCSPGHWCKSGSFEYAPIGQVYGGRCPNGTYCPNGVPYDCPKGTYQPHEGKSLLSHCIGKQIFSFAICRLVDFSLSVRFLFFSNYPPSFLFRYLERLVKSLVYLPC